MNVFVALVRPKKIIVKNKYNKIEFSKSKIFCDIDTLDDIKNFN